MTAAQPESLVGGMAYGAAELLGWMVNEKGIEPHRKKVEISSRTSSES